MKCSIFTPLAVAVGFSNQIRVVQGQARVLILGDSYASGNGARNATTGGSPNYAGIPDCYKSPTSFGGVFATLTNSTLIANRGCSGGLVSHVLNARPLVGSVPFDGSSCPNSPFAPEEVYTQVNSTSCSKSAQPQITAVDKNVDLILFAAGGNDLVFGDIVRYCLFFGFRDVSDCRDTINLVRSKLADVGQSLTEALVAMAPLIKAECKVVVVAYPHIVQNIPFVFQEIGIFFPPSLEITNNLRSLGNDIEAAQLKAVNAANQAVGRNFVDLFSQTKALFDGHEPHPSALTPNPDRWIWETQERERFFILPETYHLNPTGHVQLGAALAKAYPLAAIAPTTTTTKTPTKAPTKTPTKAPTVPVSPPVLRPPTRAPVVETPSGDDDEDDRCRGPFRCLFRLLFGWLF